MRNRVFMWLAQGQSRIQSQSWEAHPGHIFPPTKSRSPAPKCPSSLLQLQPNHTPPSIREKPRYIYFSISSSNHYLGGHIYQESTWSWSHYSPSWCAHGYVTVSVLPHPPLSCTCPLLSLCHCTAPLHSFSAGTDTSLAVSGLRNLFGFCVAACTSKFPVNKSRQPFEQKPACDANEATWGSCELTVLDLTLTLVSSSIHFLLQT